MRKAKNKAKGCIRSKYISEYKGKREFSFRRGRRSEYDSRTDTYVDARIFIYLFLLTVSFFGILLY
jgi:hypothetical protein